MDELIEAANPEYFMWNFDQGFLPMDLMKDRCVNSAKRYCRTTGERESALSDQ